MSTRSARQLADRLAIADLVNSYALACDRADGEAVAGLFTEDGILEAWEPGATQPRLRNGRAEIAAAIASLTQYRATAHLIGAHTATVDPEQAFAVTRCQVHHVSGATGRERDRVWHLHYDDDLVLHNGDWYLRRRTMRVDFVVDHPLTGS